MSSVSAVISLLQIPLFKWESSARSNVVYVNQMRERERENTDPLSL